MELGLIRWPRLPDRRRNFQRGRDERRDRPPVRGRLPHGIGRRPGEPPALRDDAGGRGSRVDPAAARGRPVRAIRPELRDRARPGIRRGAPRPALGADPRRGRRPDAVLRTTSGRRRPDRSTRSLEATFDACVDDRSCGSQVGDPSATYDELLASLARVDRMIRFGDPDGVVREHALGLGDRWESAVCRAPLRARRSDARPQWSSPRPRTGTTCRSRSSPRSRGPASARSRRSRITRSCAPTTACRRPQRRTTSTRCWPTARRAARSTPGPTRSTWPRSRASTGRTNRRRPTGRPRSPICRRRSWSSARRSIRSRPSNSDGRSRSGRPTATASRRAAGPT